VTDRWVREVAEAWSEAFERLGGLGPAEPLELGPTPRVTLLRDGSAALYRFGDPSAPPGRVPIVLVPSLINRWYVLDLRRGSSLVEALVAAGFDTYCLDWGVPSDEDRYLSWDEVLARLARAIRKVRRATGAGRVALLGYCMGGTLAAIHAAQHPDEIAALIDLAGPIDFARAGRLRAMVDPRWFDADAIADAGNVSAEQMQGGFAALRPTLELVKWVGRLDRPRDPADRAAAAALEAWAADNIPFPGAAYRTYIRELYQDDALAGGRHIARGRAVTLAAIRCPTMAIVAERDAICPPESAIALTRLVGGDDTQVLRVPGGHVGAVVGRAASAMYASLIAWLRPRVAAASPPDRS
jgi:polyhydroxyalkanoate synthase